VSNFSCGTTGIKMMNGEWVRPGRQASEKTPDSSPKACKADRGAAGWVKVVHLKRVSRFLVRDGGTHSRSKQMIRANAMEQIKVCNARCNQPK
jgi:hypothetical protein